MMNNVFRKTGISTLLGTALLFGAQTGYAAPGALAPAPLFVTTAVEPNVFFTFDDSGSMDWETMVDEGTGGFTTVTGRPIVRSYSKEFYSPPWETDCNVIPPVDLVPEMWIFLNHHGNKNYYNPETTERPNIAEINIAKHRNGPTGTIDLYWHGQLATFRNLQRQEISL